MLSNSVLRRYTPPTCTLEVVAKGSPLSRWAGQPVLKHLRFQLTFDDPRLPEETERVMIRGDRTQLEALCEVVETYVHGLLQQSSKPLGSALLATSSYGTAFVSQTALRPASDAAATSFDLDKRPQARTNLELNPDHFEATSEGTSRFTQSSAAESHHRLEAPVEESSRVENENLEQSALPPATVTSSTAGIYLQPEGLLHHHLYLGMLATEASGSGIQLSTLQLFDLATALDEYTSEVVALPTLTRPSWLQPSTAWVRTAAIVLVTVGLTTSIAKLLDGSRSSQEAVTSTTSQGASSQDQQQIAAQIAPTASSPRVAISPLAPIQPLPPPPPDGSTVPPAATLPKVDVPGTAPAGSNTATGEAQNSSSASRAESSRNQSIAIPDIPIAPPPPPAIAAKPNLQTERLPEIAASQANNASPSTATLRSAAPSTESRTESNESGGAASGTSDTAFDTIPQVAEARSYFRQQWSPPAGLKQTLEYNLLLNADGSIQQIAPLGQAAGDYIDRTGIPLVGEPFVSPIQGGHSPKIRVVLGPDGSVQTFLEALN